MKKKAIRFISAVFTAIIVMLPVSGGFCLPISAAASLTVSFSAPAIPCDTGSETDLSTVAVQLTQDGTAKSGLNWSSEAITITGGKVKAESTGVYPLKASDGTFEKTVYLVAKAPADSEYVLYNADFSSFNTSELRQISKSSSSSWSVSGGKLIMDSSAAENTSICLAFPSWLSDFGDYHITAVGTVTKAVNDKRWASVMSRIQQDNGLYYQFCIRQNATAENGTEFAERRNNGTKYEWNVMYKAPFSEKLSATGNYTFEVMLKKNTAATYINGKRLVYADNATTLSRGLVGLQVNACRAEYSSFRVSLMTSDIIPDVTDYAEIADPESNIALPPIAVTEAGSDIDTVIKKAPAAAVFDADANLTVKTGGTVSSVVTDLHNKVIPVFRVTDTDTARAVANELKRLGFSDAYVMSQSKEAVRAARDTYSLLIGIYDQSGRTDLTDASLEALRQDTNSSGCRVVLLPSGIACRKNVEYLQRLFITVWTLSDGSDTGNVAAVTSGANGVLTNDPQTLYRCFTEYFKEKSVIRTVQVIAHRGVPAQYQENSLAGAKRAYELGATAIENDIHLTADGVIVVMHDATIDRTTNGSGSIGNMTYKQLSEYVLNGASPLATEPIPTLEDYFREFKGKDVQLIIEIKSTSAALIPALAKLVDTYDIMNQVNFISFTLSQLTAVQRALPGVSCGALTSSISMYESYPQLTADKALSLTQPNNTTFNPSYSTGLGENSIKALSYRGMTVWPWTVNTQSSFEKFFLYGTNGITTNYSNWVTDSVREISAPSSVELKPGEATEFKVTKTTYGRASSETSSAEMTVIDGNASVSYLNGQLTSSEAGEATVIFRVAASLGEKTYYLYTEPVKVTVQHSAANDTEASDTTADTVDTVTASPSDNNNGCSCSSFSLLGLISAVALFGCALTVKKH